MLVELAASKNSIACENCLVRIAKNMFIPEENVGILGVILPDKFSFYAYMKTEKSWDNIIIYQYGGIEEKVLFVEQEFLEQRNLKEGQFAKLEPMVNMQVF